MRRSYSQRTASFPRTPTTSFGRAEGRDAPILTGQLRLVGHPELGAGAALYDRYAAEAEESCRDPAPRVGTIRGALARRIDVYASEQLTYPRTSPRVSHASPSPRDSRCQRRSRESGADGGRSEARHIPDGRSLRGATTFQARYRASPISRLSGSPSAAGLAGPRNQRDSAARTTRRPRVDRVPESHSPTSTRSPRSAAAASRLSISGSGPSRTSSNIARKAVWIPLRRGLEICAYRFGNTAHMAFGDLRTACPPADSRGSAGHAGGVRNGRSPGRQEHAHDLNR
jgi:hypothetical protein